jgi:tellurite resistance protein TerC
MIFMLWLWFGFICFVLLMLALDLGVFHRHAHVISIKEAIGWTIVWATLGISFAGFVYFAYEGRWFGLGTQIDAADGLLNDGATAVEKYLTGYVVEKSLSVDNVFVIAMIFGFFAVPAIYQHRVLFWGILGALVMRGAMIAIGNVLITQFHWVLYLFGAFLVLTALKMLVFKAEHGVPNLNSIVRLTKRFFPVTDQFHGESFLIRAGAKSAGDQLTSVRPGALMLTPLALALIMVESTDVIFAVDSIPAIFAITADPFLVFTSNVFAILGLRSLYSP